MRPRKPHVLTETEPDTNTDAEQTDEGQTVNEWRHQQLVDAGWQDPYALLLACDHEIDLHHACDLIRGGCDPALAWEILA